MIADGRTLATACGVEPMDPRAYLLAFYPDATIPPLDDVAHDAPPLEASVNHGIWIAACGCGAQGLPSPGCVVFFDAPLAWCVRCDNADAGGAWRTIALPTESERVLIEELLECRRLAADRNWEPRESVDDLAVQNVAHGEPLPRGWG